jgi:ABC-type branched-subunit amino acid transport system ATPase component
MSLRVTNLAARYGDASALFGVDLVVSMGETVGVLGRNGAGKSTLLRSIAGLHAERTGSIVLNDQELPVGKPTDIARTGVSLVREGAMLPKSLTVEENLHLGQQLAVRRGLQGRPLEEVWDWFPLLVPLRKQRAAVLSGGQRQALALATAFVSRPSLLLLDEPSAGLAPVVAQNLFEVIARLADESGVTSVVVEQSPAWLHGLVERSYLLDLGRIVAEGGVREVLATAAQD